MCEGSLTAAELTDLIQSAFAEVEYPGDSKLVYDNSGTHLECAEVEKEFKGKHWNVMPLEVLRRNSASIFFLSPEAYQFYLPAYLLCSILHYAESDKIPDSIVFSLIPPIDAKVAELYRKRVQRFTPVQKRAIRSFLRFMKHHHQKDDPLGDIDRALSAF
jgi:hypothetical protein